MANVNIFIDGRDLSVPAGSLSYGKLLFLTQK